MVLAAEKIGLMEKPEGGLARPLFAMVMSLPLSLYAASFSRFGRRFMVTCTTAAQEGTVSMDPMVGNVLLLHATVGLAD